VPPGKTMFNCALSEAAAAELFGAADEVVVEAVRRELAKLPLRAWTGLRGMRCTLAAAGAAVLTPVTTALWPASWLERIEASGCSLPATIWWPYTEAALTSACGRGGDGGAAASAQLMRTSF